MDALSRRFKNEIRAEQIYLACRHVEEMMAEGVTENMAIRTLELFVDTYAKIFHGGSPVPHHVDQVLLWSVDARNLIKTSPELKPKDCLRVEHGTPRRGLARKVFDLYQGKSLTKEHLDNLVQKYWKLAVITIEEDSRLNKIARSKVFDSPEDRWAAAGIRFDDIDKI